jgi:Protein NO VEIN, C-terminal
MPESWSREEVEATVAAYLDMLDQELRGVSFNKSDARRRLGARLDGRSEGAIERKHQNISAILIELGFPYVSGYKPLSNYQRLLYDVVRDRLLDSPRVVESTRARVEEPILEPPRVGDVLGRLVQRPKTPERRHAESIIADTPRPPRPLANYLEIEARNRRLGLAGEEFAIRFEEERLWRAGQKRLAEKIEHVALTRGDGEGYDILSFEESGQERLIEVKTTTFGPHTPLFVTRNEVDVSEERADEYYIYRLFDFRDDPKLFLIPGDIAMSFDLEATQFVARLT